MSSRIARRISNPLPRVGKLTVANLITDVTRLAGVEGDGAAYPDSSVGVWPAATNLHTNGAVASNTTGWGSASGFSIERVTAASAGIPALFGSYVLKVTCTGAGAATVCSFSTLTLTAAVHRFSIYLYMPSTGWSGTNLRMSDGGTFASATGTKTVSFAQATTDVWQRASFDITPDAGDLTGSMVIATSGTPGVGEVFYLCGAQVTANSIDFPYIHTDGGTASRSAGSIEGIPAECLDETQAWLHMRVRMGAASSSGLTLALFEMRDDNNNRIIVYKPAGFERIDIYRIGGGAGGRNSSYALTWAVGDVLSVTATWSASGVSISVNGGTLNGPYSGSVPVLTESLHRFGNLEADATASLRGSILWAAIGKGTLTGADAALFHAWGNNDPLPHMFPKSAQLSFLAHFNGDGTFYRRSA